LRHNTENQVELNHLKRDRAADWNADRRCGFAIQAVMRSAVKLGMIASNDVRIHCNETT
jgi:hypothetical protein